jgi:predicted nucleic acid-binding protein
MKLYLDVSCLNRPYDDQNQAAFERAAELAGLGFKPADAVHVAAAEQANADVLLSCDDRLCRLAKRRRRDLQVKVASPVDWLKEVEDADA